MFRFTRKFEVGRRDGARVTPVVQMLAEEAGEQSSLAKTNQEGRGMKLIGPLSSLIIASAVGSFAPVSSIAQQAIEPTPFILASGLEGPRGLRFGPDGYLYVAEAGTGGTNSTIGQCPQVPGAPGGPGPDTGGLTGRISKISPGGKARTVASGFPPATIGPGGANGTIGVADVVFLDGD